MDRFEAGWLFDFYGPLLTPNRRQALSLYLEEDLSLGEIAQETGITRQGVYDALRRAQAQLSDYEDKLGLMRRYRLMRAEVDKCREYLKQVQPLPGSAEALEKARQTLEKIERIER